MAADSGDRPDDGGVRRVARWIVGALGAAGALLAFVSLSLPWYTLKTGPTFTGLDLLRANQLAYTAGYVAGYTPLASVTTCMSGVVVGIGLPIGLTLGMCVVLLLVALAAVWRAPRGRWGWGGMLVWVVGGWVTLFFLFPWITALVNVDPYRVHGYAVEIAIATDCAYPGVSDYGQNALHSGLAFMCVAGLSYGLLYGPSASRLAQVGAVTGIVAFLAPSSLAPLSFAGMPVALDPTQSSPIGSGLLLIPLGSALVTLAFAHANQRDGTPETRRWLTLVCLVGAPLSALLTALIVAIPYIFSPEIIIIGPGISLLFLSDALLFVAGAQLARGAPDTRPSRRSRREADELFWQARLSGKEPWPLP